jgi:hypothetical protein
MHNKASYSYTREDAAQKKKSYVERYGSKAAKTSKAASKYDSDDDNSALGEGGEELKVRTRPSMCPLRFSCPYGAFACDPYRRSRRALQSTMRMKWSGLKRKTISEVDAHNGSH